MYVCVCGGGGAYVCVGILFILRLVPVASRKSKLYIGSFKSAEQGVRLHILYLDNVLI